MKIPFEPTVAGVVINVHLILEYLAFFLGYRYYVYLRKRKKDEISGSNRLSIILGATLGAWLGSRVMGFLEHPVFVFSAENLLLLFNLKTIMGGLFGGLLGVELAKKIIGEKQSSGDLFTFPIILGIFIGRIGCFLSGTNEFTFGRVTSSLMGMDLGDGLMRHPLALYELFFLMLLFIFLRYIYSNFSLRNGLLFQLFMLCYFGFRFLIEFLKPNLYFIWGLSSIQWLCIICYLYYGKTLLSLLRYAGQKIHLL